MDNMDHMEILSMFQKFWILFKLFYLKCHIHEDYSISFILKRKLEYKSMYMSSYVRPNIVMKTIWEIYKMPLYVDINVVIKPNWQSWTKLAIATRNNEKWQFWTKFWVG
jgi:hypothetical protein